MAVPLLGKEAVMEERTSDKANNISKRTSSNQILPTLAKAVGCQAASRNWLLDGFIY